MKEVSYDYEIEASQLLSSADLRQAKLVCQTIGDSADSRRQRADSPPLCVNH